MIDGTGHEQRFGKDALGHRRSIAARGVMEADGPAR